MSPKIISLEEAEIIAASIRNRGLRIGLCHGCFDMLHPGHIRQFELAKTACDYLFVSVTTDRFVGKSKGPERPILSQELRAYSIASLQSVDGVTISDAPSGIRVINAIKPAVYIKGAEYRKGIDPLDTRRFNKHLYEEVQAVRMNGGDISFLRDDELSTTEIIAHIKRT